MVWVHLQPYRHITIAHRLHPKLSPHFFGPYIIIQRIGDITYKLKMPARTKVHNVFHIFRLKQVKGYISIIDRQSLSIGTYIVGNKPVLLPEEILEKWTMLLQGKPFVKVLVRWSVVWEELTTLSKCFFSANLEVKVLARGMDL